MMLKYIRCFVRSDDRRGPTRDTGHARGHIARIIPIDIGCNMRKRQHGVLKRLACTTVNCYRIGVTLPFKAMQLGDLNG